MKQELTRRHAKKNLRVSETIKQLDLFPKFETETETAQRVQTQFGGMVSVVVSCLIAWLVMSELYFYLFPKAKEELIVDTMFDSKLHIHIDIEFPRIPCVCMYVCILPSFYSILLKKQILALLEGYIAKSNM
ncbi:hypothetical protein RFI_27153 [Reticulomyxa filosa]|uniref:Endoplasmic reticulum vesicle transporter N-terminal domain-containing protein n=1 Tax=Reticulomyxa filosa TaxID=46433 RepID=X6MB14_RETFI|nr:hypothetical protein RFI_27153 [Reticulomyxa filosa]|eukprot:ETO10225.1 hypothetical protein RFI_27153 [Reticulomyxa filosa]